MISVARIWLPNATRYTKGGEILDCPGWKVAYLTELDPPVFKGLNLVGYSLTAEAICLKRKTHRSPDIECDCGFYSFNNLRDAKNELYMSRNLILLYTENYGEIHMHTKGAKSQEQDVIEMYIPKNCSRYFCKNKSQGLAKFKKYWAPSCGNHPAKGFYTSKQLADIMLVDVSLLSD